MATKVIKIDLDQARPENIEDDVSPLALAAAVETLENWNERRLAVVDEVLTNWASDAISRPDDREGLVDLIDGTREHNLPAVLLRSIIPRCDDWHGQRPDDLRNKDLCRLLPQLSVRFEVKRVRIHGNLKGGYARRLGHGARLIIETGIGHDYGGNSNLLSQDCRVTRTRCADSSAPVPGNDGIATFCFRP